MNALILTVLAMNCHQPETLPPPILDVAPLLRDLGGDYKARTAAFAKLRAMGKDIRPQLIRAANDKDLEVARRVATLIRELDRNRVRDAIDLAFPGPMPYIDMIWHAKTRHIFANVFCGYMDATDCRLFDYEFRDSNIQDWTPYRKATRALCYDLAEAGVPMWAIRSLVAELQAREETWYRKWRKSQGQESIP